MVVHVEMFHCVTNITWQWPDVQRVGVDSLLKGSGGSKGVVRWCHLNLHEWAAWEHCQGRLGHQQQGADASGLRTSSDYWGWEEAPCNSGIDVTFFRWAELVGASLSLGWVSLTSTAEQVRVSILEGRIRGTHLTSAHRTIQKGSSLLLYTHTSLFLWSCLFSVLLRSPRCCHMFSCSCIQNSTWPGLNCCHEDCSTTCRKQISQPSKEETSLNMLHLLRHTGIRM